MEPNPALARWLLGHRREIESRLALRLGPAAPRASGPEAETLRRFRTFASTAVMRGEAPPPALDGLRPDERRVMSLLGAWREAASELAGPEGAALGEALKPLIAQFRLALRTSSSGQRKRARVRTPRRAVASAIDRVADGFLAVDVANSTVVDANPAAGALLGVDRDSLFGLDLMSFVPTGSQGAWWSHLDAVAESNESIDFDAQLKAVTGEEIRTKASTIAFTSRGRTLALVMLRHDPGLTPSRRVSGDKTDSLSPPTPSTSHSPLSKPGSPNSPSEVS